MDSTKEYFEDLLEKAKDPENKTAVIAASVLGLSTAAYGLYKIIQRKGRWTTDQIPDLSGKVYIVTGASSGIGIPTVQYLAEKNATVILAVRNIKKGQQVLDDLKKNVPGADLVLMLLDLASLESVREFSANFHEKYEQLNGLVNNAGIMAIETFTETVDGLETQIGVNHFGHFALTGLLIDLLLATPNARIVNVSSSAHSMATEPIVEDYNQNTYTPWLAYGRSKAANILFTKALQNKLAELGELSNGLTVTTCHPGWTSTGLQVGDHLNSVQRKFMRAGNLIFSQRPAMGCLPTLYALFEASGGEFVGPNGLFALSGWPVIEEPNTLTFDKSVQQKLWDDSIEKTGVNFSVLESVDTE